MWCGQGKQSGTGVSWWWVAVWRCGQLSLHSSCLRRTPARVANPAVVGSQGGGGFAVVETAPAMPPPWQNASDSLRVGRSNIAAKVVKRDLERRMADNQQRQARASETQSSAVAEPAPYDDADYASADSGSADDTEVSESQEESQSPSQRPRPRNPEALPQASAPAATVTVVEKRQKCAQARLACLWQIGKGVAAKSQ